MKIVVNTNTLIRKFLRVYYMTSQREPTSDMFKFADFFSETFYKAAETAEVIHDLSRYDGEGLSKVWLSLFDRNLQSSQSEERVKKIKSLLDQIDIPISEPNDATVSVSKKELLSDYEKYEAKIRNLIKRVFGFSLPESIDVILDIAPRFGQGKFLEENPPIIALSYQKYTSGCLSTLLHELLHYLISKNNMSSVLYAKDPNFEEALLDYFSPHGIFDEELGISGKIDLEKHQAQQVQNRPASATISKKLLPLIKEYINKPQKETVWEFLKRKEMLNF